MAAEQQKTAIVTGAAGGIGQAVTARLAGLGWTVLALDRNRPTGDAPAGDVHNHALDLADHDAIAAFWQARAAEGLRVDALVNNAAIQGGGPIREQSPDDFERFLRINATAPWLMIRHGLPLLAANASIVNIGSVASVTGFAGRSAYCASKHALLGITRSLAAELAPIRVNLLCLGSIDTPALRALAPPGVDPVEKYGRRQLLERLGSVEEAARAAVFLVSDDSSFVTGSIMTVDGGLLVKGASAA